MLRSMTGYGSARGEVGGLRITLELKSVNNRYLDCSVRLPRNLLFAEETVKQAVSAGVERGKVDVFVTADSAGDDTEVAVNLALAGEYVKALRELASRFELQSELSAASLARFPDVLQVQKKELDQEEAAAALAVLAADAVRELNAMRAREGARLSEDMREKLAQFDALISIVERRSPETVSEYRARLTQKLRETLENTALDEARILTEAAIFADKVTVDEETVRLRSHITEFDALLRAGSPVGRKLDFLLQEMNREANTIGSKCADASLAHVVVDLKAGVEKLREQIQNIE